jgi:K+ transporter
MTNHSETKLVSHPNLLVSVNPKLGVSLFRKTTKTNLFVLDNVKINLGPSFGSFC